jgi:hypothetical protein
MYSPATPFQLFPLSALRVVDRVDPATYHEQMGFLLSWRSTSTIYRQQHQSPKGVYRADFSYALYRGLLY